MLPGDHIGSLRHRARSGAVAAAVAMTAAALAACSPAPASPNLSTASTTLEREGRFDCHITRQRMTVLANSMSALPNAAKTQAASLPTTAVATFKRLIGPPGSGVPAVEQFEVEKQRYDGLAASARANECPTAEIDAVYKAALEKIAPYRAR